MTVEFGLMISVLRLLDFMLFHALSTFKVKAQNALVPGYKLVSLKR